MTTYQTPLQDMQFLLANALAFVNEQTDTFKDLDSETAFAVLAEAAKLAEQTLSPLNLMGDEQGCQFKKGKVTTPEGFIEAYQLYIEGGWTRLNGDKTFGGMAMPYILSCLIEEIMQSANLSFALYPALTNGACMTIYDHGSEEIKQRYLPKMYAGTWTGTMALTEAQAGSDLSLIKTKAIAQKDGSYQITGSKIFITGGEHDLTENIIHLVLAKLPGSPEGSRGISMFLIPKFLLNKEGEIDKRNNLSCGSIEHKMGIKASATCLINFDQAIGYLIGKPNRGLAAMFTMMNHERLIVGIQGLACGQRSYYTALDYAKDRLQGQPIKNQQNHPQSIIEHPDIRKMLLTIKTTTEAGRAFYLYLAQYLDLSLHHKDPQKQKEAQILVSLMTPVAKAFLTDIGLDNCITGQQILGGHGYIKEWGQEQLVRDVRITQIYEGTNGIQAMDLIERKILADQGQGFTLLLKQIRAFIKAQSKEAKKIIQPLSQALDRLEAVTRWILKQAPKQPLLAGSCAMDYLHLLGYTIYSYMWARMSIIALLHPEENFYQAKLRSARFFNSKILPRTQGLMTAIKAGSTPLYDFSIDQL